MATTNRADLAKQMFVEAKYVFLDIMRTMKKEDWKQVATVMKSTKKQEDYDTVGNLKPAHIKAEEGSVEYGTIQSVNSTTVVNRTIANGFAVTMEAKEDEQKGVINRAKMSELGRTMMSEREEEFASIVDTTSSAIGADGVAYAATNHPLQNSPLVNSNLITGEFGIDKYEAGFQAFYDWKSHYGQKYPTRADKMLANRKREVEIAAMLQSQLRPFEESNTKNTTYQIKTMFNLYIEELPVYLIDSSIPSFIMQRRKNMTMAFDYDKRSTFNFYFNVHERYRFAIINPGFGWVKIDGEAA